MNRPIYAIAADIACDWKKPYFGAVPYIEAMCGLTSVDEMYGCDSAKSILAYFLANANTWRGDTARAIKVEINQLLK